MDVRKYLKVEDDIIMARVGISVFKGLQDVLNNTILLFIVTV